jgi:hypothetical protein
MEYLVELVAKKFNEALVKARKKYPNAVPLSHLLKIFLS